MAESATEKQKLIRQPSGALMRGEDRDDFDHVPESLLGKTICVSSTITEYKGKPEIKVSEISQIGIIL